jgi:hypothetical protein
MCPRYYCLWVFAFGLGTLLFFPNFAPVAARRTTAPLERVWLVVEQPVPAEPIKQMPAVEPVPVVPAAPDNAVVVQARGPVHEAFAQPVNLNVRKNPLVPRKPPAPIDERPPEQKPEGDNVQWIPGYWAWDADRNDFVWVSGCWRAVPPGRRWVPGYWAEVDGAWRWVSGFWQAADQDRLILLPAVPSSLEIGPSSPAPNANSFYTPGSWSYDTNQFVWCPGYWNTNRPGWEWNCAGYNWTPNGCANVGGYWDYSLANRGLLFAPVCFNHSWGNLHGRSFCPNTVVNPQFLTGDSLWATSSGFVFGAGSSLHAARRGLPLAGSPLNLMTHAALCHRANGTLDAQANGSSVVMPLSQALRNPNRLRGAPAAPLAAQDTILPHETNQTVPQRQTPSVFSAPTSRSVPTDSSSHALSQPAARQELSASSSLNRVVAGPRVNALAASVAQTAPIRAVLPVPPPKPAGTATAPIQPTKAASAAPPPKPVATAQAQPVKATHVTPPPQPANSVAHSVAPTARPVSAPVTPPSSSYRAAPAVHSGRGWSGSHGGGSYAGGGHSGGGHVSGGYSGGGHISGGFSGGGRR